MKQDFQLGSKSYKTGNERRFKRLKVDYLVKYQPEDAPGAPEISNLRNLSAGGVLFLSHLPLQKDQRLVLSFWVPPLKRIIECKGKVIRMRRIEESLYLASVSYLDLDPVAESLLNELIERIAAQKKARAVIDHRDRVNRRYDEETILT